MNKFFLFTLLLSFNAFPGQEGNGPVLNVSSTERKACILIANEYIVGTYDDLLIFEDQGETHYLSREALKPKCCAIGAMNCLLRDP